MRIRERVTNETRNVTASNTNGSTFDALYIAAPSGPPTRAAMWWRAWFWLRAVGSSSWATTDRTADASAGPKTPAPTPVSSAATIRWAMVSTPSPAATATEP